MGPSFAVHDVKRTAKAGLTNSGCLTHDALHSAMEQPEISNKRPRHADIEAHSGLKEPVSKRSINRNLQNTHETTTPSDAPRYVDSGINLTRVAACTEEENIDTGILFALTLDGESAIL